MFKCCQSCVRAEGNHTHTHNGNVDVWLALLPLLLKFNCVVTVGDVVYNVELYCITQRVFGFLPSLLI